MTDHLAIANAYLALWNEVDDANRTAALTRDWTADGRYVDPLMEGEGPAGISAMIAAARAHFPAIASNFPAPPTATAPSPGFPGTSSPPTR